ncbi:MAG: EAL domain-containing protein [Leptolyngbyaceae cyanobacterium bins.59]|nr:EAL domain-containing protein [Leptolyngbyaceae cyanobacterium bins.59]
MVNSESRFSPDPEPSPLPSLSIPNPFDDAALFVSHELRTPLTSIQGALRLLHTGQLGSLSEEGQRLLTIAINNTNRLTRLACAIEHQSSHSTTYLTSSELKQIQLENELTQALDRQEFYLMYQPIIAVESHRIVGFEALVRWQHPTQVSLSPDLFIPIAEKTGAIHALGTWVLEEACQQLRHWQQQFPQLHPLTISVNLSSVQLDRNLPQKVAHILQTTGIAPECLKLEITETAAIENQEVAFQVLSALRQMGMQLYVDDFGVGYSSLARLPDLPVDTLKIDRSFVQNRQWDICAMIIQLASRLKLGVIAEGIEHMEALIVLKGLGCRYVQGYFFSKPLTSQAAGLFLEVQANSLASLEMLQFLSPNASPSPTPVLRQHPYEPS